MTKAQAIALRRRMCERVRERRPRARPALDDVERQKVSVGTRSRDRVPVSRRLKRLELPELSGWLRSTSSRASIHRAFRRANTPYGRAIACRGRGRPRTASAIGVPLSRHAVGSDPRRTSGRPGSHRRACAAGVRAQARQRQRLPCYALVCYTKVVYCRSAEELPWWSSESQRRNELTEGTRTTARRPGAAGEQQLQLVVVPTPGPGCHNETARSN